MVNYKEEDKEVNFQIVKRAIEAGINFFDTSEIYHHGICETELGNQLKQLGVKRENVVISTKICRIDTESEMN